LAVLQEGEECSVYEMRAGAQVVRLTFEIKADDRYLPVSLASMVSKYIRELLMDRDERVLFRVDAE
jgi:ribonuclease HII